MSSFQLLLSQAAKGLSEFPREAGNGLSLTV
jgi:hypothetical protein